jgi:EmrB/QacA subfamily drug resistance transporter
MTSSTLPGSRLAPDAHGGFTHRQILTILSGLLLGMLLAALDQTVVSTAIRTVADDLQGFEMQAWATTAFLITSTISTPLYGKLSDIYGRRPFYLAAITIFLAGSVLCGMASSMYELATYRAVQGVGAGGLMSLALAILGDIVPPRERSRYQGLFLGVWATSSVVGPVVGGFFAGADEIVGIDGWRWIFYINVPVGIAAFLVVGRVLRLPHTRTDHRIDWPGALSLVLALVPLLTVAEQGRDWGWGSGRAIACYAVGAVGLVAFVLAERAYGDEALLPLRMFANRSFSICSISSFIVGSGMFGAIVMLPLYLQVVKGSTPTEAGLQTLPMMLGIMVGALGSGQVIARTGAYRRFPLAGAALMVTALYLFHLVGADTPLWRTMIPMAIFGVGLGFNMQPVILAVQNAVNPREMGVATASVTFFRQMGGTLGAAVFLSILFSTVTANITSAVGDVARTDAFRAAVAANPRDVALLRSGSASLDDTSFINRIDPTLAHPFKVGFSESMGLVFLIAAGIIVIGLVVVAFLPNVPLRNVSGVQARQADAEALAIGDAMPTDSHAGKGSLDGERPSHDQPARPVRR